MTNHAADSRGYVGGERKRVLTPEQVAWARDAAHGGASARDIQYALEGAGVEMGLESIRRMLRGETYGNVGRQMHRRLVAPIAPPPGSVVGEAEVEASARRLQEALIASGGNPPAEDPDAILRRFGADVAQARERTPDAMLAELTKPTGENPFGEALPPA